MVNWSYDPNGIPGFGFILFVSEVDNKTQPEINGMAINNINLHSKEKLLAASLRSQMLGKKSRDIFITISTKLRVKIKS